MLHFPFAEKTQALRTHLRELADRDQPITLTGGWFFAGTFQPGEAWRPAMIFRECRFAGAVEMEGARFAADLAFLGCRFEDSLLLRDAHLEAGLSLRDSTLEIATHPEAQADLTNVRIAGLLDCRDSVFGGRFSCFKARLGTDGPGENDRVAVMFDRATFAGNANFAEAEVTGRAEFAEVKFHGAVATFYKSRWRGTINMVDCVFQPDADFEGIAIAGNATFELSKFRSGLNMRSARLVPSHDRGVRLSRISVAGEADFTGAHFGLGSIGADFGAAVFEQTVTFDGAEFVGPASFSGAKFKAMLHMRPLTCAAIPDFADAVFSAGLQIGGTGPAPLSETFPLPFRAAVFQKPDAISFQSATLRARSFIDVDTRKFDFVDVRLLADVDEDMGWLAGQGKLSPVLLAVAYRRLATNAEENHRYEEASRLRSYAMETRLRDRSQGWSPLLWCYKLASGYGENVSRAVGVLVAIWLIAAAGFTALPFERGAPLAPLPAKSLPLGRALVYGAQVMTLQKPDPRPAGLGGQAAVVVLTVLGPLQAALLALAVRRQFMR